MVDRIICALLGFTHLPLVNPQILRGTTFLQLPPRPAGACVLVAVFLAAYAGALASVVVAAVAIMNTWSPGGVAHIEAGGRLPQKNTSVVGPFAIGIAVQHPLIYRRIRGIVPCQSSPHGIEHEAIVAGVRRCGAAIAGGGISYAAEVRTRFGPGRTVLQLNCNSASGRIGHLITADWGAHQFGSPLPHACLLPPVGNAHVGISIAICVIPSVAGHRTSCIKCFVRSAAAVNWDGGRSCRRREIRRRIPVSWETGNP
jgi:hypothetical protein